MYKILIVDDDMTKTNDIMDEFKKEVDDNVISIEYELETKKACKMMEQNYYDLLILDIQLPTLGLKKTTSKKGGIELLHVIENFERIKKPGAIIGLTSYDENYEENAEEFLDSLWVLIKHSKQENEWLKKIRNKVSYFMQAKKNMLDSSDIKEVVDCGIIVAVENEMDAVLRCGLSWEEIDNKPDSVIYYHAITKTGKKIVLAQQQQKGLVAAAVLTEKLLEKFNPSLICMVGITAGREGEVKLGDIIVASESWDYGCGKIKAGKDKDEIILEPEIHQIAIDTKLQTLFMRKYNKDLYDIRSKWNEGNGREITEDIKLHIGALASGAAVIQNEDIVTKFILPHNRKLLGLDMETYAVYYAAQNAINSPKFLSIKAVSDYANKDKNDDYQKYAAFISIQFLLKELDDILILV